MNYALAKQLKEAGFPQPPTQNELGLVERGWVLVPIEAQERGIDKFYYSPTLSELIEACGKGMKFELVRAQLGWYAKTRGVCCDYNYQTPEEAVAHLWLKLKQTPKE